MAVIRVPKTPRKAFDKSRPVSNLLKAQLEHLEAIVHPAPNPGARSMRTAGPPKPVVRTEGQAAAYIQELTRELYAQKATPLPAAVLEQPLADNARGRRSLRDRPARKPPRKMGARKKSAPRKGAQKRKGR
jgi:hypothetical protein